MSDRDELVLLIGRCVDRHMPGIPMAQAQAFMRATADAVLAAGWMSPGVIHKLQMDLIDARIRDMEGPGQPGKNTGERGGLAGRGNPPDLRCRPAAPFCVTCTSAVCVCGVGR